MIETFFLDIAESQDSVTLSICFLPFAEALEYIYCEKEKLSWAIYEAFNIFYKKRVYKKLLRNWWSVILYAWEWWPWLVVLLYVNLL
jgi:hypothetical protein